MRPGDRAARSRGPAGLGSWGTRVLRGAQQGHPGLSRAPLALGPVSLRVRPLIGTRGWSLVSWGPVAGRGGGETGRTVFPQPRKRDAPARNYPSCARPPPPAGRRPGKHQRCSPTKQFCGPDLKSCDVEIEISHSEGPQWPPRSAGGFRVRPPVSHGERWRPDLAPAAARAPEALRSKRLLGLCVPPPGTESTVLSRGARPAHLVSTSAECNLLPQTDVCARGGRGGTEHWLEVAGRSFMRFSFCGMWGVEWPET